MAKPGSEQPEIIFTMSRVSKIYNNKTVIKDISLGYYHGAKIGVVGANGAGKSTVLRIMAGVDHDFNGHAVLSKGYTTGMLEQEPKLDPSKTVREIVEEGAAEKVGWLKEFNEIGEAFADPDADYDKLLARQAELQDKIDAAGCWDLDSQLEQAMDALRCPDPETPISVLSGGERRRVALCMALLEKPDLLLLDEPTNHLDAETVEWLEQALREYAGTVVIVTHDRYFLDNITRWILELESGRGLPFEGNYSSWLAQKAELLRVLEKKESQRQRALQRELEWIRNSHEGRLQKNQARIKAYEQLAGQEIDARSEAIIQIAPGPRLGEKVLSLRNVCKGFVIGGERAVLLDDCTFDVPRGAIVGVIGPNGTGKTTLLRMVIGEEQPDSGTIELGPSVVLSYVDQHRDALTDENTVFEEITGGEDTVRLGNVAVNSRLYLARFNFRGPQQQKKVGECSGGERNRIHLAQMLRRGGNLLLLDEPTNDLDVNTLRVLEQAMIDFPGCALVISHDRFFLDRIATHILVLEGDGKTRWFEGNFAAYEAAVRAEDPERVSHRRSKYKRLTLR